MKFGLTKRELIIRIIFFVLVGIIFCFFVRRLFFGMDVGDEVFNICNSYRVLHGNRLLVDVWDFYQLGDCFLAPFVWVYVKIAGSTDGIVLACRLFYLFINICIGTLAYWVLKDYFKNFYAKISVSLAIIFYAPFSMYYLWYDTAGQLFFLVGVLFLLKDMKEPKKRWKLLAGLFHSFMVIAYPSAVAVVIAELIILFLVNRKRNERHGTLLYFAGGMIPLIGLVIYGITQKFDFYLLDNPVSNVNQTAETAVVHAGLSDINFSFIFSRGADGVLSKLFGAVTSLFGSVSILKVIGLIIAVCIFVLLIRYTWKKEAKRISLAIYVAFGVVSFAGALLFKDEYNRAVIFAYMFLAVLFLAAIITKKEVFGIYKHIVLLAAIPSVLFFLVVGITAAHGGTKAFIGLWVLCTLGLGLYLETGKLVLNQLVSYYAPIFLIIFCSIVTVLFNNQYFEYDGTSENMNTYVDRGIYKGLWIPDEYMQFIELEDEVNSLVDNSVGSVALFDEFPSMKYLALEKQVKMSESGSSYQYVEGLYYANFLTYWERFGFPDAILIKNDPEWYDETRITTTPGSNFVKEKESEHYILFRNVEN